MDKTLRFTTDQLRAGYARNADGLRQMLATAERTGHKVNGFTADELRQKASDYVRYSTMTDAELAAHLAQSRERMTARLAEIRRAS